MQQIKTQKTLKHILKTSYKHVKLSWTFLSLYLPLDYIEDQRLELVSRHIDKHINIIRNARKLCELKNFTYDKINLIVYRDSTRTPDVAVSVSLHKLERKHNLRLRSSEVQNTLRSILKLYYSYYKFESYLVCLIPLPYYDQIPRSLFDKLVPVAIFEQKCTYKFPRIKNTKILVAMRDSRYSLPAYNFMYSRLKQLRNDYHLSIKPVEVKSGKPEELNEKLIEQTKEYIDESIVFYTADKSHVNEIIRGYLELKYFGGSPNYIEFENKYYDVVLVSRELVKDFPWLISDMVKTIEISLSNNKSREVVFNEQARSILKRYRRINDILKAIFSL